MSITIPPTKEIDQRARLLSLAGNEVRLRIFCLMYERDEACVSEIADALGMSVASISHHLQLMKDNGLFETERRGSMICYRLVQNSFTHNLKPLVCD